MAEPQKNTSSSTTPPPKAEEKKAPELIFVENTTKALIGIPQPVQHNNKGRNDVSFITDIAINLKPGLNRVRSTDWELAKKQHMVQVRLDEGHLREVASVESLGQIAPDEAKKLIAGIVDKSQLEEWLEVDRRKEIRTALEKRIADLEKPEPGSVPPKFRGDR